LEALPVEEPDRIFEALRVACLDAATFLSMELSFWASRNLQSKLLDKAIMTVYRAGNRWLIVSQNTTNARSDSHSEIESFSETDGASGQGEGFGDFIDTSICQAVNVPDRG